MKFYLLVLASLGFFGCSTPALPPQRTSVPVARRFESHLLRPSHRRNCAVTLVRESGVAGSGLNLFLDGDQIARMTVGEVMTVYLKPGRHLLVARPLFSPSASLLLQLQREKVTTVRISDRSGNFELKKAERAGAP